MYSRRPPPPPPPPRDQATTKPAATIVPDTHTEIFTRIPSSITKSWTKQPVSSTDLRPVDRISRNHEISLIDRVSLTIKFDNFLAEGHGVLNNESDSSYDRILAWQETRKDWAALETSISKTVDEFVQRAQSRMIGRAAGTLDSLTRTYTEFELSDESQPTYPTTVTAGQSSAASRSVAFSDVHTLDSTTIHPHDSPSAYNESSTLTMDQIADMIYRMKASNQQTHAPKSRGRHRSRSRQRQRASSKRRALEYLQT
jgi:hypothetical protein